mmetsp:Transcript_54582/g.90930  ORF Transcript_54582/g.90930 Transcript_54582/m.90930 type:complete len:148 (-) Transcript_54582:623-1066(-)
MTDARMVFFLCFKEPSRTVADTDSSSNVGRYRKFPVIAVVIACHTTPHHSVLHRATIITVTMIVLISVTRETEFPTHVELSLDGQLFSNSKTQFAVVGDAAAIRVSTGPAGYTTQVGFATHYPLLSPALYSVLVSSAKVGDWWTRLL